MGDSMFMDEKERKWQLFEEHMRQVEEEQQRPHPDLFFQRSIGCFIGGILGPMLLFALFCIDAYFHPDEEAGGILFYLFIFVMAVPVGGIFTAILSPFIVRSVKNLWRRNRK
jgi:hypothetical protein